MRDTPDVIGSWGPNIARARRARGLTQEALGRELGVAGFTVSRWEGGHILPSLEKQLDIATWFGVSITELFPRNAAEAELVAATDVAVDGEVA